MEELADPGIVVSYTHFPEPLRGVQAFQQALAQTYEYFPDIETTAEEVIATGDRAVVRWAYRGTHQHGEMFGLSSTGRQVEVPGITIYQVKDGKVVAESGLVNTFSLMLQLGAAPTPV